MRKISAKQQLRLEKSVLLLVLMLPLARIIFDYFQDTLGANLVEAMTHRTGDAALQILLLSLAVTPIQRHFRFRRAVLFRRLLGLTAFFYASLHFSVYLVFDQELSFGETLTDVAKRPYITMGFSSLVIMLPLAITSTDKMIGSGKLTPLDWSYFAMSNIGRSDCQLLVSLGPCLLLIVCAFFLL